MYTIYYIQFIMSCSICDKNDTESLIKLNICNKCDIHGHQKCLDMWQKSNLKCPNCCPSIIININPEPNTSEYNKELKIIKPNVVYPNVVFKRSKKYYEIIFVLGILGFVVIIQNIIIQKF